MLELLQQSSNDLHYKKAFHTTKQGACCDMTPQYTALYSQNQLKSQNQNLFSGVKWQREGGGDIYKDSWVWTF